MENSFHAIVIGIENHSESFDRIHLFEAESGYRCVLKRRSSKKISSNNLDIFQNVEISVQQKTEHDIGFVKEFTTTQSRTQIGSNYQAFDCASRFCRAVQMNAKHMPVPEGVFELLTLCLDAWNEKPSPEITLFKGLYRLAYEDGFPIKEDWLLKLNSSDFEFIKQVLFQEIEAQTASTSIERLKNITEELIHWLTHQHDFLF